MGFVEVSRWFWDVFVIIVCFIKFLNMFFGDYYRLSMGVLRFLCFFGCF